MPRLKSPKDLSIEELRQLMVEKRRQTRMLRLDRFRNTGRVVQVTSSLENANPDYLHSEIETDASLDQAPWHQRLKPILDRLLLVIEILAVIGFIYIILSGMRVLRDLNAQFSLSLLPPTLTPTPLIVPVILPSGHTPPDSKDGAQPNDAEIPAHLLPIYQSMALLPIPTPGPEQAVRIQVPAIDVDAPIVQGDNWEQLKKGVAQHAGTANPGQVGNLVLSAHNDVYGEIFRHLDQLQRGDEVIIYTATRAFTYMITGVEIVLPTAVEYMAATPDASVTLISCYPYMIDNKRIVVQASLQEGGK